MIEEWMLYPVEPGVCMFCGGGPMSGEHIVSEWLHPLLKTSPGSVRVETGSLQLSGHQVAYERSKAEPAMSWQGTKVRRVCKPCNEGWMGDIEQGAQPTITAMVRGESAKLKRGDLQYLRQWACLKAMMIDVHYARDCHAFSPSVRRALMERGEVPSAGAVFAVPLDPHTDALAGPDLQNWTLATRPAGATYTYADGHFPQILITLALKRVAFLYHYDTRRSVTPPGFPWAFPPGALKPLPDPDNRKSTWVWRPTPKAYGVNLHDLHHRFDSYNRDRATEGGSRRRTKLKPPRTLRAGRETVTPMLPWRRGPLLHDLLCSGCDAVICEGLNVAFLGEHFPTSATQQIVVCPECGSLNDMPVPRAHKAA